MKDLIGRMVISTAGHDMGSFYVVLSHEEKFLYLSDGKYHPIEKLKKKSTLNIMHLLLIQKLHCSLKLILTASPSQ